MEIKNTLTHTTLTVRNCTRVDGGHFVLSLSNSGGTTSIPVNVKVLDKPGPPDGPLRVKVVSGEKCNLHWNPPVNDGGARVSHYVIEKRETSRVTWTGVEPHVEAVSYKVTKLVPGKEYIFRIAAVNKFGPGEFLESEPFIAQNPFTTPSAPSIPIASAVTGDSILLTWERPETDGGSEIDGYILEKRDKEGVRWTKCNKRRLNDLRFRCMGLTEGHYYQFRVMAENAAGLGSPSEPSEYIKICEAIYPPGPPINFRVTDYSCSTVSLTWSKPIYDGGAAITAFTVEMQEAAADGWITCSPSTGVEDTNYTVKRLRENVEYNFRIRAMNAAGVGEPVDLPASVVASEKLEAPEIELDAALRKIVSVRACSTLRLFVNIKGRPEPEVKWSKEGRALSNRAQIEVTNSYTVLLIENVNRDDTGKYVLTAENYSGSKSAFVNVRVLDSPSAPANLEVKDVKKDSVSISWETPLIDGGAKISHYIIEKREEVRKAFTSVCSNCIRNSYKVDNLQEGCLLSWERPDHDGGSKITCYVVEIKAKEDDTWTRYSESKALTVTINGLAKRKEYFFRVSAVNEKGKSEPKSLLAPVIVNDNSSAPIINLLSNTFSVKAGNDLKIDVPFKSVPTPAVVWKKDGNLLKETIRVNSHTSDTSSQIIIKDTIRTDVGTYEVSLTNTAGTTSADIHVNVFERPEPPSDLSVDEVSADFVCLSWKPPHYTGGCQISNYVVEKRDTNSTIWQPVSSTVARTSTKISRLTQGTEYQFRIATENRYGKSPFVESEPVAVLDRPGPPAGPLEVSGLSAEKCTLTWGPPHETGGAEIMYYIIEKCETSRVAWILVYGDMIATTCKVTKLLKGNEYLFRVRAVNKYGEGETLESEPVKAMDPFTVPSAPTDVEVASATSDTMTICWKRPSTDGGSRISGYIIEKREKQAVRWVHVNKKPVYDVRVKASCFLPCPLTLAEDPKFLPSPPTKPSIIDSSRSSITLSWNKPVFDGGAAVTGYKVEVRKSAEEDWTVGVHNTEKTEFTVTGLTSGAEYVFTVRSINKIGTSEPSLETDPQVATEREEEPKFDVTAEMRKTLLVKDGSSFTLTVPFTGKPVPNVTWDKADVDLRVRGLINTSSSVTSITVEGATRDDSGKYKVKLQNIAGSASLTLSVRVLDSPGPINVETAQQKVNNLADGEGKQGE
uniref:Titin n=1 Tax=Mola mola TaxID=94237 RepID=A0A3Q3XIQ0_MOLML